MGYYSMSLELKVTIVFKQYNHVSVILAVKWLFIIVCIMSGDVNNSSVDCTSQSNVSFYLNNRKNSKVFYFKNDPTDKCSHLRKSLQVIYLLAK